MTKKRLLLLLAALVLIIVFAVWFSHSAFAPGKSGLKDVKSQTAAVSQQITPSFDKTQYSTTDPTSIWVIVNKQHPLNPKIYVPTDLVNVGNGQYLRAEAAKALTGMLADAKAAGFVVGPYSGYRSYTTQVNVYNSEVKANGQKVADNESARPGYSEHQTGWAVDLEAADVISLIASAIHLAENG